MSESKDSLPTESEMEVELSAQDLIDLTPPHCPVATATVLETAPAVATVAAARPANTPHFAPQSSKRKLSPRAMRVAAIAAVSVVAAVSVAELAPPQQRRVEHPVSNWSPVPDPVVIDEPELPPTRYANPFDPSEVFELPPGLSRDEARAMVEELLLQRASERGIYGRAG